MGLIEKVYAWDNPFTIKTDETNLDVNSLMDKIVTWITLIVGILAFIYLVYAGIQYITAAGDAEKAKKGQQGIIYAIIGIIIAVLAYTIVSVIGDEATGVSIR